MIREVIRTERMPPWHADPHYGVFKNNRALSSDNMKTLVHWIEAGAPRGTGSDPLADLKKTWPEWAIGTPNLVLELPAYDVPASGVVPYQDVRVKNTIGRDVWLKAIDDAPGDRAVVHHILGYSLPAGMGGALGANRDGSQQAAEVPGQPGPQSLQLMRACSTEEGAKQIRARVGGGGPLPGGASIGGYVPGASPKLFPPEVGVLIKKDADFRFQVHYTTNGKAARDVTRVGSILLTSSLSTRCATWCSSTRACRFLRTPSPIRRRCLAPSIGTSLSTASRRIRISAARPRSSSPNIRTARRKRCCRCPGTTSTGRQRTASRSPS